MSNIEEGKRVTMTSRPLAGCANGVDDSKKCEVMKETGKKSKNDEESENLYKNLTALSDRPAT